MPVFWLKKYLPVNLIEGSFIWDPGISPESSLKSNIGPRRIADSDGL